MTKSRKRWIALAVVTLLGALGLVLLRGKMNVRTSSDKLVLYGNVDIRQVDLAFNGADRISAMFVQEGDIVKKGQLLATLETTRLRPAVEHAEAIVKAQSDVVSRLLAGSRPEEVRKAIADVNAAEAELTNAQINYSRMENLAQADAATKQNADNAKAGAEVARARLRASKEMLNLLVAGPRKEDIEAAKATLDAYKAEMALAQRQLADANLFAPSDGIIQNRILEPGDMASPARPAYTLALTDPVWVRTYVSEPEIGKIWPGMAAEIATDSYPDKRYAGWVGYISPTAEFTPKSVETRELRTTLVFQVRVYVKNPENELRLGMPATVTVELNQPRPTN